MAGAAAAAAAAAAIVQAAVEETNVMLILGYIGFNNLADREAIRDDALRSYDDALTLTEKDVSNLSKDFKDRTIAQGRIQFGLRRTNDLKLTICWAQDFRRISKEVTLEGITDAAQFKAALAIARQREVVRSHNMEGSDNLAKAADPGKLKRQQDWIHWSRGLENYLSTILGQDGVPLNYIIRINQAPDHALEEEPDYDFQQLTVAAAPLSGAAFKTDARRVHQLIHGFVQGEIAETWIKPKEKKQDGRIDFQALQAHYGGEGSKSVRIQDAEALRKTLYYKSERAMKFETFLTNMQTMFTGFDKSEEEMKPPQQIRLLFDKVQCPALQTVKNSLQVAYNLDVADPPKVTYDFIANSLSAEASKKDDHSTNRQVSGLQGRTAGTQPESGVKGPDGVIFTGFYDNYAKLSKEDKDAIHAERKRLNMPQKKPRTKSRNASQLKTNKKKLSTIKREIASLKVQFKDMKSKKEEASDDDDEPQSNAGDQFGGRKGKKAKKGDKG
jgi:hypothetical protein